MYNFDGKIGLVTGAAGRRGIGRVTAIGLAQSGADVMISDIPQFGVRGQTEDDRIEGWQGLNSVADEIRALGRKVLTMEADICSSQQVENMVERCIDEFGKIDVLVNNAGITGPKNVPVIDVSEEDWNRTLSVNLTGTYLCAKAVAKRMIEQGQGGKIINVASIAGKLGQPYWAPYSVSKFGVVGLTQILALELAQHKIYVNAVCPGYIATEINLGASIRSDMRTGMSVEEATAKAYSKSPLAVPLGRAGQPDEVAKVITFLASTDSDYMTGQALNVTGGTLMCH